MKPETLLYSLNELDDDLLGQSGQTLQEKRPRPLVRLALVASLVLVLGLGSFLLLRLHANRQSAVASDNPSASEDAATEVPEPTAKDVSPDEPRPLSELALDDPEALGSQPLGVGAMLLYESEDRILFYGDFGVVCYDLTQHAVAFTVSYPKAVVVPAGAEPAYSVQGSAGVHVEISADGSMLSLQYLDAETGQKGPVCLIDVPAKTYVFRDPYTEQVPPLSKDGETRSFAGSLLCFGESLDRLVYLRNGQRWYLFYGSKLQDFSLQQLWALGYLRGAEPLRSLTDVELCLELNLWTRDRAAADPALQTMPVFENQWYPGSAAQPYSLEDMMTLTEQTFTTLGVPDFQVEISPPSSGASDPETLTQHTQDYTVTVTNAGTVTVTYATPIPYPESPEFDRSDPLQVRENYVNFLFNNLEIPWRDSVELDAQSTQATADPRYEAGRATSPYKERILADQLRHLHLELGPAQELLSFSFDAEPQFRTHYLPLGDYPIRSADEATEALTAGQYYCDVQLGTEGSFAVSKAIAEGTLLGPELVYNTDSPQAFLLPWYRWWAPVDAQLFFSDAPAGSTAYVPVYVPALAEEYCSASAFPRTE